MADEKIAEIAGRYSRFTSVLGKGSFKTVYRAFDSDECLEVAWNKLHVERLQKHVLEKVANEVKLLERVQHKNIIRFFALLPSTERNGVKTIDFITEQMTSGTLKDYLKRANAIKLKVIRRWSFNILGAIEYLHAQDPPIMHRDLKCENIFINGHVGEVKIGDLGLSGVKVRDKADSVIGTPEFMAPELYESSYTEKVDIYAFGMCLLEMVTMEYPYSECSNFAQIFKKVYIGEKPKVLDRIKPGPFKNVINACLQREENRPSASQLLNDPLFKDWESDSNIDTNSSLLIGHSDNRQVGNSPNGNQADERNVIEWNADLSRTVLVSTENNGGDQVSSTSTPTLEQHPEVSVIEGNQTGGVFKVGLTMTIENQIKRVEFSVDPFQDTSKHLAQEMCDVFKLPAAQMHQIENAIESQIQVAWQKRDAASRNATPQPSNEPSSLDGANIEAPVVADTSGLAQPVPDHGPTSNDGSGASYNPTASVTEPALKPVPEENNTYIQQPNVTQISERDSNQYQNNIPVEMPQAGYNGESNVQTTQRVQEPQPILPMHHPQPLQTPVQPVSQTLPVPRVPTPTPPQRPQTPTPIHHAPLPLNTVQDQPVLNNVQSSQHPHDVQTGIDSQHHQMRSQPLPGQMPQHNVHESVLQVMQNPQQPSLTTQPQIAPPAQSVPVPQGHVQPPQAVPSSRDGNSVPGYTSASALPERVREPVPQKSPADDNSYVQHPSLQVAESENASYRNSLTDAPQGGYTSEINMQTGELARKASTSLSGPHLQPQSQHQPQQMHGQPSQGNQNTLDFLDNQASFTSQREQQTSQALPGHPSQTLHTHAQPAHNVHYSEHVQDPQAAAPMHHSRSSTQLFPGPQAPVTQTINVQTHQLPSTPQWSAQRGSGSSAGYSPAIAVAEPGRDPVAQTVGTDDKGSYIQHTNISQTSEPNSNQYGNIPVDNTQAGYISDVSIAGPQQGREIMPVQQPMQVTQKNSHAQPTPTIAHPQQRGHEVQTVQPTQIVQAPTHTLPVNHVPVSQQPNTHVRPPRQASLHQTRRVPSIDGSSISNYPSVGAVTEPARESLVPEENNGHVHHSHPGQVSEPENNQYPNTFVDNSKTGYNSESSVLHSQPPLETQSATSSHQPHNPNQSVSAQHFSPSHNSFHIQPPQQALPTEKWLASCLELMDFCSKGYYRGVLQKLDHGYPATFADYDRRTPLHLASARGHPEVARLLIERGANVGAVDRWGRTPLKDAVLNRHDTVANILRTNGAEEDMAVESTVFNSIMLQSAAKGDLEEVRRRLVAGANANFADYDGRTALHLACTEGHSQVAELLLVNEASWSCPDNFGCTPVNDAVRNGHRECLRVLRQYGAEIPRHLLGAHSDTQHQLGLDLVENAAKGRINAVRKCLRNGANPNFQDYDKRTALHLAAVEGHVDIVEILLQAGSDWTALDRWGTNARDEAANANQTAVLDELDNWARRSMRRNNSVPGKSMRTVPNGRRLGPSISSRSLGQSRPVTEDLRPSTSPVLSSMSLQQLFSDNFVERKTLKTSHSDSSNGVVTRTEEVEDPEMMEKFRMLRKQMEEKLEERYNEECKIVRDNLRATRSSSRDPRSLPVTETLTPPAYGEEITHASERLGAEMEREEKKSRTSVVTDEGEGVGQTFVLGLVEDIVSRASGASQGI